MEKSDSLYINASMFYDKSINGWKIKYGSYDIFVKFTEHESQLDITVKKYGHILGTVILESDVTTRYVENTIAKIIKEEIDDNARIDGWAIYKSDRDFF